MGAAVTSRRRLRVRGTVQGVGFRPFVYRLAHEHGLDGFVRNDGAGVWIEVEGTTRGLTRFEALLRDEPPPLARIVSVDADDVPSRGGAGFRIVESASAPSTRALVPADVAPCDDCLRELFDPRDRRHRYPFINCTACGPRYTVVTALPYDRARTTMSAFPLCAECHAEYEDPTTRRFHAEPTACTTCGPSLRLIAPTTRASTARGEEPHALAEGGAPFAREDGARVFSEGGARFAREDGAGGLAVRGVQAVREGALRGAVRAIAAGGVVAVKGAGGYLLAVDAWNAAAVARLRARKRRPDKPFALMARGLAEIEALAHVSVVERAALLSPARPIVLLRLRDGVDAPEGVAPRLREIGMMLPSTPLHALLLADGPPLQVMTSGNARDEPIAKDDEDAFARLGSIADVFLAHDRPIHTRVDDSVVRVTGGATQLLRRARGFVPEALALPKAPAFPKESESAHPEALVLPVVGPAVLAVGADLKNAVCLTRGGEAFLSQHVGDLAAPAALDFFVETIDKLAGFLDVRPAHVAHDLHPEYRSTRWALACGRALVPVQHHHAHVASCLAEHGRVGPAIGVAFDGTGCGPDGSLWGGELLVFDLAGFRRAGHLRPLALPGGEAAIREPWRLALAALVDAGVGDGVIADVLADVAPSKRALVERMIARAVATPHATGAGRWFDAVAAIAGGARAISYEGQAAIELAAAATNAPYDLAFHGAEPYELAFHGAEPYELAFDGGEPFVVDLRPTVRAIAADVVAGASRGAVSARFHETVARAIALACRRVRAATRIGLVALSGGCFQNRLLSERAAALLGADGFEVFVHRRVPPNDGGVAFGQAAIASCRLWRRRNRKGG
ncbi:MAG: carbamoyltransferase HypF [Labilithrix sp.]|nr:carbamoyltransferase HypF [Labilithrix sp.]MCW5815660.1 carbamoyltransferase HypF [Labilithrix sp.]